ncbi:MAG: signal peptide peptidase SppA [Chlorobi bacterium]|nr:signal peptide peptidase SppA [Chlorobiota bacterium]
MKTLQKLILGCLGLIVGIIIGFFLLVLLIGYILVSMGDLSKETELKTLSKPKVLYLNFRIPIAEVAEEDVDFTGQKFSLIKKPGLYELTEKIIRAANDPNVKAVYLDLRDVTIKAPHADAIREALTRFKKQSDKPIYAFADIYTTNTYYIASVADSIFMTQSGNIILPGFKMGSIFIGKLLEKLGVSVEVFRIGKYKTAAESLYSDELSPESREMLSEVIQKWDSIWLKSITPEIVTTKYVDRLLDSTPVIYPEQAKKLGFAILISDEDTLKRLIANKFNLNYKSGFISISKYVPSDKDRENLPKIAVVYAVGSIVRSGNNSEKAITWNRFRKHFNKAVEDDDVAAIVLRINSPGGDAFVADEIWHLIKRSPKPVVVSMGALAASGGYYIAAPAKIIFAEPFTITGSIGVIAIYPNATELLRNKLGVNFDYVKSRPWADVGNPVREFTEEEKQIIWHSVHKIYNQFISRVAESRNLPVDSVDKLGRGRIYSSFRAQQVGLIDSIGYLQNAIQTAARIAEVTEYNVVLIPEKKSILQQLMQKALEEDLPISTFLHLAGVKLEPNELQSWFNSNGLLYRLPYYLWQNEK